jgi:glycosyltransferase involved in cell wall biosynthesis
MFAGNIATGQDFPAIIKAAEILKNENNVHWVILGDGSKKAWAEQKVNNLNLNNNFHFLGRYPLSEMPKFYSNADAMLFSLEKEYIYSITIPAKVQTYLACGKPILAMIDGEASAIIRDAKAGLTCGSGDAEGLAKNVLRLSKFDKMELKKMGLNGHSYYKNNFEREMLIEKIEKIFESLILKNEMTSNNSRDQI